MHRSPTLVLMLALATGACGTAAPESTSPPSTAPVTVAAQPSTVPSAPVPTSTSSSTITTLAPPPTTTLPEREALDRSVLTFGLGDETSGRFQLIPNLESRLSRATGTYWVLADGNVYTRFDVDAGLIAEEMGGLVATATAESPALAGTSLLEGLENHYRGTEYQIGITDVVRWYDRRVPSLEMLEQASVILGAGVFPGGSVPEACRKGLDSYEAAARAWVRDLDPQVRPDTAWEFPVADYDQYLAGHLPGADACGEPMAEQMGEAAPEIEFRVSDVESGRMIEVLADDGVYTDHQPTAVFTVLMQPDDSVGPTLDPRDPEPLLGLTSTYLVAVGACGELPWAHTEFAGGDTWVDPAEEPMVGVTFLADRLACFSKLPDGAVSP